MMTDSTNGTVTLARRFETKWFRGEFNNEYHAWVEDTKKGERDYPITLKETSTTFLRYKCIISSTKKKHGNESSVGNSLIIYNVVIANT